MALSRRRTGVFNPGRGVFERSIVPHYHRVVRRWSSESDTAQGMGRVRGEASDDHVPRSKRGSTATHGMCCDKSSRRNGNPGSTPKSSHTPSTLLRDRASLIAAGSASTSCAKSQLLPSTGARALVDREYSQSKGASAKPDDPGKTTASGVGVMSGRRWGESGGNFKQGKFSKAETDMVVDAIRTYARINGIPVERICNEGGHKGDLKGAWISIAECLPERTIQSIYRHGKRQLNGLKKGVWTEEEVAKLLALVEQHGHKWRLIEKHMGRSSDTCRDKYREHMSTPIKGAWTQEEEEMLTRAVKERMQSSGRSELQGHEKTEVQWAEVAKQVKTRNRIACMKKWEYLQGKRLEQRLLSDARSKRGVDLSFVWDVLKTGAEDESEVTWTRMPYPRAQRRWMMLRKALPAELPVQEAAKAIIAQLQQEVEAEGLINPYTLEPTPESKLAAGKAASPALEASAEAERGIIPNIAQTALIGSAEREERIQKDSPRPAQTMAGSPQDQDKRHGGGARRRPKEQRTRKALDGSRFDPPLEGDSPAQKMKKRKRNSRRRKLGPDITGGGSRDTLPNPNSDNQEGRACCHVDGEGGAEGHRDKALKRDTERNKKKDRRKKHKTRKERKDKLEAPEAGAPAENMLDKMVLKVTKSSQIVKDGTATRGERAESDGKLRENKASDKGRKAYATLKSKKRKRSDAAGSSVADSMDKMTRQGASWKPTMTSECSTMPRRSSTGTPPLRPAGHSAGTCGLGVSGAAVDSFQRKKTKLARLLSSSLEYD